jgi:GNAT superfamily N-acetyltransferase
LRHFAVDPAWTRRGVARALWERTWEDVQSWWWTAKHQSSSCQHPTLEVYSTLTAEPFYTSLGFVPVENLEIQLRPNCLFPTILMRRESRSSSELDN